MDTRALQSLRDQEYGTSVNLPRAGGAQNLNDCARPVREATKRPATPPKEFQAAEAETVGTVYNSWTFASPVSALWEAKRESLFRDAIRDTLKSAGRSFSGLMRPTLSFRAIRLVRVGISEAVCKEAATVEKICLPARHRASCKDQVIQKDIQENLWHSQA